MEYTYAEDEYDLALPLFDRLQTKVSVAEDVFEKAQQERDEFVKPIVREIFSFNPNIDKITTYGNEATVYYSGSKRGCSFHEDVRFPKSILYAKDPLAAAKQYKQDSADAEKAKRILEKKAQLERLLKEVNAIS